MTLNRFRPFYIITALLCAPISLQAQNPNDTLLLGTVLETVLEDDSLEAIFPKMAHMIFYRYEAQLVNDICDEESSAYQEIKPLIDIVEEEIQWMGLLGKKVKMPALLPKNSTTNHRLLKRNLQLVLACKLDEWGFSPIMTIDTPDAINQYTQDTATFVRFADGFIIESKVNSSANPCSLPQTGSPSGMDPVGLRNLVTDTRNFIQVRGSYVPLHVNFGPQSYDTEYADYASQLNLSGASFMLLDTVYTPLRSEQDCIYASFTSAFSTTPDKAINVTVGQNKYETRYMFDKVNQDYHDYAFDLQTFADIKFGLNYIAVNSSYYTFDSKEACDNPYNMKITSAGLSAGLMSLSGVPSPRFRAAGTTNIPKNVVKGVPVDIPLSVNVDASESWGLNLYIDGTLVETFNGTGSVSNLIHTTTFQEPGYYALTVKFTDHHTDDRNEHQGILVHNSFDLAAASLTATNVYPAPGETIQLTAKIKNKGPEESSPSNLYFSSFGQTVSKKICPLSYGNVTYISWSYTVPTFTDKHTVSFNIANSAVDGDSSNNSASLTLDIGGSEPAPDPSNLALSWISHEQYLTGFGTNIIDVRIKNKGLGNAPPALVHIYVDDQLIKSYSTSELTYGNIHTYTLFYSPEFANGTHHTIRAVVDPYGHIVETTKSDNTYESEFYLTGTSPPDLVVTDVWTVPSNPNPGDTVSIYATVKNKGGSGTLAGTKPTKVDIGFMVDGQNYGFFVYQTSTGSPLRLWPGESFTALSNETFTAGPAITNHDILGWVDPFGLHTNEVTTSNNQKTVTVTSR